MGREYINTRAGRQLLTLKLCIKKGIGWCLMYSHKKCTAHLTPEVSRHIYITAPCFALSIKVPFSACIMTGILRFPPVRLLSVSCAQQTMWAYFHLGCNSHVKITAWIQTEGKETGNSVFSISPQKKLNSLQQVSKWNFIKKAAEGW